MAVASIAIEGVRPRPRLRVGGALATLSRRRFALSARTPRDLTRDLRRAQRAVEEAEQRIATLEAQITTISSALEDPQLYTRPTGPSEARTLGGELETLKGQLDATLERWTAATEEVEALNRELASIGS